MRNPKRFSLLFSLCIVLGIQSQEEEQKEPPEFMNDSADENYSYLQNEETAKEYERMFAQGLKFIPFNKSKTIYLTLGGAYRPRFESTINEDYTEEDDSYYSQRLNLNSAVHFGKNIRLYAELYHGFTSGGMDRTLEDDQLDLHQAFAEFTIPQKENAFVFTFGRKQLTFGAGRLVDRRDGPNIRRSFELIKTDYRIDQSSIQVFYGTEEQPQFDAFDNEFNLVDD
ncbi:MAG: alginate export family protein, partial [Bacteroidota bacterium]